MALITDFRKWAYKKHDVDCNQKYNGNLPYSFHLGIVESHVEKYGEILSFGRSSETEMKSEHMMAIMGAIGHDLIEDARVTYNDLEHKVGKNVANIIYCLTDEKGRNRNERHSDIYFEELAKNEIAVFVKLCDIISNVKFSLLTNSSMYNKYRKEYPYLKEKLYNNRFDVLFTDLEKLLKL